MPCVSVTQARTILQSMGVSGATKSIRFSLGHCGRPDRLVLGKNVRTDLRSGSSLELESRFLMGVIGSAAVHPRTNPSRLEVHDDAVLKTTSRGFGRIGAGSTVRVEGEFEIGDSYINGNAMILAQERITVGSDCAIAWNVTLVDSDRHTLFVDGERSESPDPISIADDVWIGHNTTIGKGVTVGEGAVVASNSVVTKDVPPDTLVAGCPAEVKSRNVEWNH